MVQIGWVVLSREKGKVLSTGRLGARIGKVYANQGRARQVASYYGGEWWRERYVVIPAWITGEWNNE